MKDQNQTVIQRGIEESYIEADVRIIPHIAKSIKSGLKKVALNDTDIYVLLLHCTPEFIKSGLTELLLEYDIGIKV